MTLHKYLRIFKPRPLVNEFGTSFYSYTVLYEGFFIFVSVQITSNNL